MHLIKEERARHCNIISVGLIRFSELFDQLLSTSKEMRESSGVLVLLIRYGA